MARIYNSIVETIGRTPLVKLNKVTAGLDATITLMCDSRNHQLLHGRAISEHCSQTTPRLYRAADPGGFLGAESDRMTVTLRQSGMGCMRRVFGTDWPKTQHENPDRRLELDS